MEGVLIIYSNGSAPLNKMATMTIYGKKNTKNHLLQNQESFKAESWCISSKLKVYQPASVARLDALSDWRSGGGWFNPRRGRQHSFVEIDHEIFSTVILSLPLIQEGQLSVSGKRMCTILVNRLED